MVEIKFRPWGEKNILLNWLKKIGGGAKNIKNIKKYLDEVVGKKIGHIKQAGKCYHRPAGHHQVDTGHQPQLYKTHYCIKSWKYLYIYYIF